MAIRAGQAPEIDTRDQELPSVLAVVVTHNGRPWLRECLAALANQSYELLDVLVVDDATFDARKQPQIRRIAKRHLQRKRRWGYLRTPRALGFGGAINWAMSRVRTDADLLLFIHDDAALEPHAVEHMAARLLDDDQTAIVGPKIVDWDDPQKLEEVGMLADRFGYPYKGLEEGEIDLGQHDSMSEVFYVTSTCILMRHGIFRELKGWDARLQAFAEDLDLGWRARLLGYSVRVEPRATARHAVALATGKRPSPFTPSRYYIRRNRLRTVFKNASSLRLLALVPQFILLTLTEMLGFIVLRQPREILNLTRALLWNVAHLPQTFSERARIQRKRRVSDLKLSRLTVKQTKRVRFYISHQRDRMEEIWGRRAELFSRRTSQVRIKGMQLRGWLGVAVVLLALAIILGFRNIWWSPQLAVGELLPFPDRGTGVWRAFLSPWRGAGLGQPAPNSPALAILGFFPFLALGAAGAAQKLLIVALGVAAFAGAYRLVSDLVDRPGRLAAGMVYVFGSVGYAGIRAGALGALVFGAAAPYVLHSIVRIAGWTRPPNWYPARAVARVALGTAVSAAFIPGALVFYAAAAVLLSAARSIFVRGEKVLRSGALALAGIVLGWAMLLPWSAQWFSTGGPLATLRGNASEVYASSFAGNGMIAGLLGQVPEGQVLFGLALPLLGLVAVIVGEGQRRRMALALWLLLVVSGGLMTLVEIGYIKPFFASPVEAGVMLQVCWAGLAGLAIGAFRLDLPRRGLGLIHGATLFSVTAAAALLIAGAGQSVLQGGWAAGKGSDRENEHIVAQVRSLFAAEAQDRGQFRALWVGEGWTAPIPVASRPIEDEFVTGSRGQVITDLFERRSKTSDEQFRRVIDSVESGATDRGGALLGAFNIRFIVLQRAHDAARWLAQRDLALVRAEPDYLILRNDSALERAALYPQVPQVVRALSATEPEMATAPSDPAIEALGVSRPARFLARQVSTPGTVFLAEAHDPGWRASMDGEALERVDAGWGNGFEVPAGRSGTLEVVYPRSLATLIWLIGLFLAWVVVAGASFSRRKRTVPEPRAPRRTNLREREPLPVPQGVSHDDS